MARGPRCWEMERVTGIEPVRSAWEADRLPLHHTRVLAVTMVVQLYDGVR